VQIGFRPEAATLTDPTDEDSELQLPVYATEPLGNEMIVAFRIGDDFLNLRVPADAPVDVGQNFGIRVRAGHLHVFDSESGERVSEPAPQSASQPATQQENSVSPLKERL